MPSSQNTPEAQRPSGLSESVEALLAKKRAESSEQASAVVEGQVVQVQSEVADVMSGVEAPKPGEKAGEKQDKKDFTGMRSTGGGAAAAAGSFQMKDAVFPSEEKMIRQVRHAIQEEIAYHMKAARKFQGRLGQGGASDYNKMIARIRTLKQTLHDMLTATMDFIKSLYLKYFTPEGKRRPMEDIRS